MGVPCAGFSSRTAHFSQLVWAGSTYVGCGLSVCRINGYDALFHVCNYRAPGNVKTAVAYWNNVRPVIK